MSALQRLHGVEDYMRKIDYEYDLHRPLMQKILPIKRELDIARTQREGRKIKLSRSEFPDQFKAKLDRSCGFDIIWVD